MKFVIDGDDYEVIIWVRLSRWLILLGSNKSEDEDKSNVFWVKQDLVNYALHLVEDSERV